MQEALWLIAFAVGAEMAEGRHLATQRDRIATGVEPRYCVPAERLGQHLSGTPTGEA